MDDEDVLESEAQEVLQHESPHKKTKLNTFRSVIRSVKHDFKSCNTNDIICMTEWTVYPEIFHSTQVEGSLNFEAERISADGSYLCKFYYGSNEVASLQTLNSDQLLWEAVIYLVKKVKCKHFCVSRQIRSTYA